MKEKQFGHLHGVLRSVPRTFGKKDSLEQVLDFFYRNPDFNTAVVQDSRERVVGVISRNAVLEFLAKRIEPGLTIEPLID
ncbi:MAG: CBS domain-containing protein, partial [Thermodesulfobacteriota bacterium]